MDSPDIVEVTGLKRRVCVAINGKKLGFKHTHTRTHKHPYTHGFSTNEKGSCVIPWGIEWNSDGKGTTGRKECYQSNKTYLRNGIRC